MINTEHKRNCPKCNKEIYHANKYSCRQSTKNNRWCRSCSKLGIKTKIGPKPNKTNYKKRWINLEERKKVSEFHKNRFSNSEERKKRSEQAKTAWKNPESRKKYYDALARTKWIKVRTDKGQLELIEKWNKLGFNFEPNFQLHKDDFLAYLDGYDSVHNVVIELDAKYHRFSKQKEKDLIRQQKIIDILKPKKFWRYNTETKQFKNILEIK